MGSSAGRRQRQRAARPGRLVSPCTRPVVAPEPRHRRQAVAPKRSTTGSVRPCTSAGRCYSTVMLEVSPSPSPPCAVSSSSPECLESAPPGSRHRHRRGPPRRRGRPSQRFQAVTLDDHRLAWRHPLRKDAVVCTETPIDGLDVCCGQEIATAPTVEPNGPLHGSRPSAGQAGTAPATLVRQRRRPGLDDWADCQRVVTDQVAGH
jgi:hypothetical protein